MSEYNYGAYSKWSADTSSPATIGAQFLATLDQLAPLDPAMSNWLLVDMVNYASLPLAEARAKMTAFVENNVSRDDFGEPDPRDGYNVSALGSKAPTLYGSSQTVTVSVDGGSQWYSGASFQIGEITAPPDLALITYPIYRGALEALAANWPCPFVEAYASLNTFGSPEAERPDPETSPRSFDWIGYLSPALAAGLTPPADLICERTPGGGLIMSVVKDRIDPANPEHRRRAQILEAIMNERVGLDKNGMGKAALPARVGPY